MPPAASPTLRQRELAARLRELRVRSGMSVADVAQRLLISPAKLSRLETGARPPQLRDVRDLCTLYDVPTAVVTELMTLARQAREPGWWQRYDVIAETNTFVGLEASAVSVCSFESSVIPGLLQTEGYAAIVVKTLAPMFPGVTAQPVVDLRRERQERLLVESGPELWFIVDEAALRRRIGGPAVMKEQLTSLLAATEIPNVTLQVLPFETGVHAALQSNFGLLELPDGMGDIVYVEGLIGFHFLERPEEVVRYRKAFDQLRAAADGPERTKDRLHQLISDTYQ
jgi:transcriptional regulator with XRE-family HTH domain